MFDMVSRRGFVSLSAVAAAGLGLAGCSGSKTSEPAGSDAGSAKASSKKAVELQVFAANSLEKALPEVQELYTEQTGTTFAENALIKAETICKASGLPTIADDSGLCVDALDGAPGVYSARYCGHHGDDEANNDKLLAAMQAVPAGQRGAKFVSAVCFILPDGRHLTCMGECPGSIAFTRLCGDYGFGYDPLFLPVDTPGKTMAELTADEKNAISHRFHALEHLSAKLTGEE